VYRALRPLRYVRTLLLAPLPLHIHADIYARTPPTHIHISLSLCVLSRAHFSHCRVVRVICGGPQEQLDRLCDILSVADRDDLAVVLTEARGNVETAIDLWLRRRPGPCPTT
jgi:hypothetical protein